MHSTGERVGRASAGAGARSFSFGPLRLVGGGSPLDGRPYAEPPGKEPRAPPRAARRRFLPSSVGEAGPAVGPAVRLLPPAFSRVRVFESRAGSSLGCLSKRAHRSHTRGPGSGSP